MPAPANQQAAERAISDYLGVALVDPESARITFSPVTRGVYHVLMRVQPGVFMCGTINARNRLGGYTGRDVWMAEFDKVTGQSVAKFDFDEGTGVIVRLCQQVYGG